MASPFDAPVAPPSFVPQITSLGNMIDTFSKRRMELQQQQEQAAVAQANQERLLARDAEREAYGRRKQDVIEKRDTAKAKMDAAKFNQGAVEVAKSKASRGQHPGTMLIQTDSGPEWVEWKYIGGQQPQPSAAAPPAPAASPATSPPPAQTQGQPSMGGPAAMNLPFALAQSRLPPPVASATPDGQTQVDPELDALMSKASEPQSSSMMVPPTEVRGAFEQVPPGPKDSVFLDRNDEGTATALLGPEGEQRRQLQMQAFPPDAREGQTFNAEDVNLRGGKGNPFAEPVPTQPTGPVFPGSPNTIFLDRNDEGQATALSGPGGETRQTLPIEAFPPNAREGQTFDSGDVNLRGGKGNPFAEPIQTTELNNNLLPNSSSQSGSVFVPPRDIKGMSMQTGQPQGGHWEARLSDGQVITVDPNEARAAKRDQDAQDLRDIDVALADPETKLNPQMFQYYIGKKQALLGGLSPAEVKQIYAQKGAFDLQGARLASNEKVAGEKIAGQKDVEQLKQEGRIALQAAKKHGRSGGGSGLGGIKVQPDGQVEDIPIPQTRFGPRPDMLLQRVEQAWRSNSLDEKLPIQLLGLRRLKLAEHNISANGPDSGILNMEAAFNYLGFVRGGVPVQNETKEMLDHRRTWADSIHGILARAGLGEMAAKFLKGDELTKDEVNQALSVMSPAEKARITEGIHESLSVMTGQVGDTLTSFSSQFANLGGKGGHLIRQYAVDMTNQRLKANGLPSDFNPFNDTRVAGASPFMKASPGSPNSGGSSAPGGGKSTLDSKLDALNKALGL